MYATPTKPDYEPVGLDLVRYAAGQATVPFFAIGGIDPGNVGEVVGAGAERVVVVRAIRDAADPGAAARALRAGNRRGPPRRRARVGHVAGRERAKRERKRRTRHPTAADARAGAAGAPAVQGRPRP